MNLSRKVAVESEGEEEVSEGKSTTRLFHEDAVTPDLNCSDQEYTSRKS